MRTVFFSLMLAASLLVAVTAASMVIANMWINQSTLFLADWRARGTEPSKVAWRVAFNATNHAIFYSPVKNAHYYDVLGHIWDWRHFTQAYGDPHFNQSRLYAVDAYRQATILRPAWPYSWINLAYAKLKANALDDEFNQALDSAFKAGPWRIQVTRHVANIGLLAWHKLTDDTKAAVMIAVNRTVSYNAAEARWLETRAKLSGQHALFCLLVRADNKQRRGLCR